MPPVDGPSLSEPDPQGDEECPDCLGTGWVTEFLGNTAINVPCPRGCHKEATRRA